MKLKSMSRPKKRKKLLESTSLHLENGQIVDYFHLIKHLKEQGCTKLMNSYKNRLKKKKYIQHKKKKPNGAEA